MSRAPFRMPQAVSPWSASSWVIPGGMPVIPGGMLVVPGGTDGRSTRRKAAAASRMSKTSPSRSRRAVGHWPLRPSVIVALIVKRDDNEGYGESQLRQAGDSPPEDRYASMWMASFAPAGALPNRPERLPFDRSPYTFLHKLLSNKKRRMDEHAASGETGSNSGIKPKRSWRPRRRPRKPPRRARPDRPAPYDPA